MKNKHLGGNDVESFLWAEAWQHALAFARMHCWLLGGNTMADLNPEDIADAVFLRFLELGWPGTQGEA